MKNIKYIFEFVKICCVLIFAAICFFGLLFVPAYTVFYVSSVEPSAFSIVEWLLFVFAGFWIFVCGVQAGSDSYDVPLTE